MSTPRPPSAMPEHHTSRLPTAKETRGAASSVRHVVVVPTIASRSAQLVRAVASLRSQERPADRIMVITDGHDPASRPELGAAPDIESLPNRRTPGLSGAVNTALDQLLRTEVDPEHTWVSFLDDDDWWEDGYLAALAPQRVPGVFLIGRLVRRDAESPEGRLCDQTTPIDRATLLVTNPGVQGSNLTVRLADALRAGCFDEGLTSCTDRDFVLRLLDLGLRPVRVAAARAHHDTLHGGARLSDPRASAKHDGLDAFLLKYASQMSEEQELRFCVRAEKLFGWQRRAPQGVLPAPSHPSAIAAPVGDVAAVMVVGVIIDGDCPQRGMGLLDDLARLERIAGAPALELVLLENGDPEGFVIALHHASSLGLVTHAVRVSDQQELGAALSLPADELARRKPIAIGRTLLQAFVHAIAEGRAGSFAWIIDDDVRLPDDLAGLVSDLHRLRTSGIDVVIGRVSGAPPIPASSMLRVQLVDLAAVVRSVAAHPLHVRLSIEANGPLAHQRRDYYYDLSRQETDRLEAHFVPPRVAGLSGLDALTALAPALPRVFAGEALTRPVQIDAGDVIADAVPGHLRGGNTLVFRLDLLRDVPNLSPRLRGRAVRRSDMVWACDAEHRRGALVRMVPFVVRQDRTLDSPSSDWLAPLLDDVLGYAFFRAYEEHFEQRGGKAPSSSSDRGAICKRARKLATERFAAARLSAWRCQGLAIAIAHALDAIPHDAGMDRPCLEAWRAFVAAIAERFAPERLAMLEDRFREALDEVGYERFLLERERWEIAAARTATTPILQRFRATSRENDAKRVLAAIGVVPEEVLGQGAEGVVLRAKDRVFKVFDALAGEAASLRSATLASLVAGPACAAFPTVRRTLHVGARVVLESDFEASQPYVGGHGPALVECLAALHEAGWVHTNIRPDNLRLCGDRIRIIDLGRSLARATPTGFEAMVRRAFLSWRFAFRSDLPKLLRRSNVDGDFAECVGWEALRDAIVQRPAAALLDEHTSAWLAADGTRHVLDFGAGKPRAMHAARGSVIVAYDPDRTLAERWARERPDACFGCEWPPSSEGERAYDRVSCLRVLCAVDDEAMAEALGRIRRSVAREGRVLIAICAPTARRVAHTRTEDRLGASTALYREAHAYQKRTRVSGGLRCEHHRSLDAYRRAFARAGLAITDERTFDAVDTERLEHVAALHAFELRPLPPLSVRTALVLKVCALDAETVSAQARHLVGALGRPRAFDEVVVALDPSEGPFPGAHGTPSLSRLRQSLEELQRQGVVDRVVEGPRDGVESERIARRWFGQAARSAHARNGQATAALLRAFDAVRAELVLHADIDTLVARPEPEADYIAEVSAVFEREPTAVTLGLVVNGAPGGAASAGDTRGPFRVETQVGWIHRPRLEALLPLENTVLDGALASPWHRSLDRRVAAGKASSLRARSEALWYCSPDNARKQDPDALFLLLDAVRRGEAPPEQRGLAAACGPLDAWLRPKRTEAVVLVACGRNVGEGRLRRFVASLQAQSLSCWGMVFVDDASDDDREDVLERVLAPLGDRVTLVRRARRVGALANLTRAVGSFITDPDAVIVLVDPDDALGTSNALERIAEAHRSGADVVVGSMVRTDKEKRYAVDFAAPRERRGGNVWQHPRSFRRRLFDRIALADLHLDGAFVDLASDWSFMLPIVEMAERPVWIDTPLYLHEPSSTRPPHERAQREANIARIVTRPSYRRARASSRLEELTTVAYHRVLPTEQEDPLTRIYRSRGLVVSAAAFERQLRSIARAFTPVTLDQVVEASQGARALPPRPVLVTFDDGYRDFADHAAPIAQRLGVPLALFARCPSADARTTWAPLDRAYLTLSRGVVPARIDRDARAALLDLAPDQQLSFAAWSALCVDEVEDARKQLYLDDRAIRALPNDTVRVGAHGRLHVRWTGRSDAWLDAELAACAAWLRSLPNAALALAYPDGAVDDTVALRVRASPFAVAFALDQKTEREGSPAHDRLRRVLPPDDVDWVPSPPRNPFTKASPR